ncbi:MAG: hypothetical protein DRG63_09640 [Deltaproteobacteria bacterium]|nr:MAG: hypothetical protein DRG63_09640 [Deltaproteobacteria bacterium]
MWEAEVEKDKPLKWQEERERSREQALAKHHELHKLYKENPFVFEMKRKKAIEDLINSAQDPELRKRLWDMQRRWDQRMRSAGSAHNRFILAQTLFWDHLVNEWVPTLQEIRNQLQGLHGIVSTKTNSSG